MNRERTLKVVLVLVGLLFSAGIYPLRMILWERDQSQGGDAVIVVGMREYGLSFQASNDSDFERVRDITVFKPTDLS